MPSVSLDARQRLLHAGHIPAAGIVAAPVCDMVQIATLISFSQTAAETGLAVHCYGHGEQL